MDGSLFVRVGRRYDMRCWTVPCAGGSGSACKRRKRTGDEVCNGRRRSGFGYFTSHRRKDFWYNIGDLIREEGITLMRGDVLVFVARSDSRHILFEDRG